MPMKGWTSEKIREKKLRVHRDPVCRGKQKQGGSMALDKKAEIPRLHPPCLLHVTCYKAGSRWDTANIEYKSALDSLVKNSVICDDRQTEVPKIITEGVRVKTEAEERTIIELFEI